MRSTIWSWRQFSPAAAILGVAFGLTGCDSMLDVLPDDAPPSLRLVDRGGTDSAFTPDPTTTIRGTAIDNRRVQRITLARGTTEREIIVEPGPAVSFVIRYPNEQERDSVEVRAYDDDGNRASLRVPTPIYDSTAPALVITSSVWTNSPEGRFDLVGRATDANGVDSVKVEQAYGVLARLPATFDTVLTGRFGDPITVRAWDVVGNMTYRQFALRLDNRPPTVEVSERPLAVGTSMVLHRFLAFDGWVSSSDLASISAVSGSDTTVVATDAGRQHIDSVSTPAQPGGVTFLAQDGVGQLGADTLAWIAARMVALTSTGTHLCALSAAGTAYCRGTDDRGQLGNGPGQTDSEDLVAVAGGREFTTLEAGSSTTCAVDVSGVAHCWGANDVGQLGNGSLSDRDVPTPVSGGVSFQDVQPGRSRTCGLATDGAVYCWGLLPRIAPDGAVRLDTVPTPMAVSAPVAFASLHTDAVADHACALDAAGALYCWGQALGYDSTAAPGTVDTAAVHVSSGPFTLIRPMPDEGSVYPPEDPWTLAITTNGDPEIVGPDWASPIVAGMPTEPYHSIVAAEGWFCALSDVAMRGRCPEGHHEVGPPSALEYANTVGLEAADFTVAPCFLTPGGSLYCVGPLEPWVLH